MDDVVGATLRFVSHGATELAPGVLRDPFGALVALTDASDTPQGDRVAWHILHARDEARSFSMYADLTRSLATVRELGDRRFLLMQRREDAGGRNETAVTSAVVMSTCVFVLRLNEIAARSETAAAAIRSSPYRCMQRTAAAPVPQEL